MFQELKYKGGIGQWAWILHRVTGIGIVVFLVMHILDTALLGWGPDVYNKVVAFYHISIMRVGEVFLGAAILYHALNGIRIVILDFWENSMVYQKQLFWAEIILFFMIFIPSAVIMLKPIFQ